MKNIELWNGDCLELMKDIPDKSIDMIFTDLPYSTTRCHWDCEVDLDKLWGQYKRIIKKNGCIALWAQAPFSHILAMSNLDWKRYEWVIEKTKATGHLNAKKMPMKAHENVMIFGDLDDSPESIQIFYDKLPTYNPQKTTGHTPVHNYTKHTTDGECYGDVKIGVSGGGSTERYPREWLEFNNYNLEGKNVVVVGRSPIVGKPLANMSIDRGAIYSLVRIKLQQCSLLYKRIIMRRWQ